MDKKDKTYKFYLFFDSPPPHSLILERADLGVDCLVAFLLSGPAVGEPT